MNDYWGMMSSSGEIVIPISKGTGFDIMKGMAIRTSSGVILAYSLDGSALFEDMELLAFNRMSDDRAVITMKRTDLPEDSSDKTFILVDGFGKAIADISALCDEVLKTSPLYPAKQYHTVFFKKEESSLPVVYAENSVTDAFFRKTTDGYYNVIGLDGRLLYPEWIPRKVWTRDDREPVNLYDDIAVVYFETETAHGIDVYMPYTGRAARVENVSFRRVWNTGYSVCRKASQGLFGGESLLVHATGEVIEYERYVELATQRAAIVSNGPFYGLFVDGTLVGKGMQYTKITYDENMDRFVLDTGASSREMYRIGRDGTVVDLSAELGK